MPLQARSDKEQEAAEYQLKLDMIRSKIDVVLNTLNETETRRDSVRDELHKLEVKIAKISKSLRKILRKHRNSTKNLSELKAELKKLKKQLSTQKRVLSSQIRSAFSMGQQPQMKLLLNQKNPAELGRSMVYFNYLNQARTEQIKTFLSNIERKQLVETSIIATQQELEGLIAQRKQQKNELSSNRKQRKQILAQLNKDIDNQQLTLDDLTSSRSRIEQLLLSLGEILADIPAIPMQQHPFHDLKGKLPWPVRGSFSAEFGTSRNQGDLTWNGVVIQSAYGTPVRAVSNGRVVFADWLQGFGFITIIDHNDGYMTLYGHNQALYKQAGEWVEAGEAIASVGDSGGQEHSGLYFEIRSQGQPINPNTWCSSKNKHLALKD
ncbi:MAG: peptidoglycan DD-metalloendopeptidase family protein [Gammaproteobacteria bacterium]|nr:peptidoglycan DD-metalloendopeptidase family protein [Gammaproteobacteria bacterium]